MRNGLRIVDMDTHVQPTVDVLEKYVEPSFRPRLQEFDPYRRTRENYLGTTTTLAVGPIPYDRMPGEAPREEDTKATPGGRGGNEGRSHSMHRVAVQPQVQDENVEGRLQDMDLEGRDIDFLFPGTSITSITGLPDVTLSEGYYRAYHHYMQMYSSPAPDRLKSAIQVPGADPEWAVSEIKMWGNEKWVAGVWVHLKEGLPVDHPDLEPIWATMSEYDLPSVHHSFYMEPPYFPGYKDVWGNAVAARTFAHPWGASRLFAYMILGGLLDRYPNFRAFASEVGHGWLPNMLLRLGFNKSYLQGASKDLNYTPLEYAQMGRIACAAEPFEGPIMTKATIDVLGEDCLMHQSDYPHGQCWFPETAQEVMDWDFWPSLGPDALPKHMAGNAEKMLRLN